jgi:epoxyqueuosine reductase
MKQNITQQIKAEAFRLGFSACGVAKAEPVDTSVAEAYKSWIEKGHCASMDYMRNNIEKRLNPCLLLPGAKSVISLAINYYPQQLLGEGQYQFAYYAYGKDYHDVMRDKMSLLLVYVKNLFKSSVLEENSSDVGSVAGEGKRLPGASIGCLDGNADIDCKICCDTVPVLDRYWAWKGGLGWIGKNTNLIIPGAGSYFFLGEIILTEELDYDTPMESRCGNCTNCLDACPTKALRGPLSLDARRCLSYLTIEHRGDIPSEHASSLAPYVYGCDRCQLVCPYNRFAVPTNVEEFCPSIDFLSMRPSDWHGLSVEKYRTLFKGSAVKRAKYEGLVRNISHLSRLDEEDAPLG